MKNAKNETVLLIVMVVVVAIISMINSQFLTVYNLFDLLRSSITDGFFAIGVMIVMISGGIDISFPAIGAFAMYTTTIIFNTLEYEGSILLPMITAMLIGIALGSMNALFIHVFHIPTFIATLGTQNIICGILLTFIGSDAIMRLPDGFTAFSKSSLITVPAQVGKSSLPSAIILLIVISIIAWFILNHTMLGRGVYAIGGNPVAAQRVGFHVGLIQLFIYCFAGGVAGISGLTYTCLVRTSNPFDIIGTELTIIAAVVLGGTSISGGKGSVRGTLLGVFMITIISNSLIMVGISTYWQRAVLGFLIILSVSIAAFQGKRGLSAKKVRRAGEHAQQ